MYNDARLSWSASSRRCTKIAHINILVHSNNAQRPLRQAGKRVTDIVMIRAHEFVGRVNPMSWIEKTECRQNRSTGARSCCQGGGTLLALCI